MRGALLDVIVAATTVSGAFASVCPSRALRGDGSVWPGGD